MWLIHRVGAIAGDCDFIARRYTRFIAPQIIVRGRLTELLVQHRSRVGSRKLKINRRLLRPRVMIYGPTFSFAFRRDYWRVTFPVINIILIAPRVPVVV